MLSRRFLRIKALKALYGHVCSNEDKLMNTQKNMLFSIQKSYELYPILMNLSVEVCKYASMVVERNKNKHIKGDRDENPNMYFVNNRLIRQIADNELLNKALANSIFTWEDSDDIFKKIYNRVVKRDYYNRYISAPDSFENDKEFLINFYRKEIEDFEPLYDRLESCSVYWYDDIEFITSKCITTIVETDETKGITPFPAYQNDEDKIFVTNLLSYTISDMEKNIESIKGTLKNWEIERVTMMDRLILSMAMTEINHFPLIPTKVTLDEYIEITKHYSTQNSSTFVNGILDKYLSNLRESGELKKTGRGLI
ncbi:MAG: transcription antitermination factor NusB [Rikenellaceae bacterium]